MSDNIDERLAELEERLARIEREVESLRGESRVRGPYSLGLDLEEIRRQLGHPQPLTDEDIALAQSIIGILDDPDLPLDLAERWREYRYGAGPGK